MTEQENVRNELLPNGTDADSKSPTSEEGGDAKVGLDDDVTTESPMTCVEQEADFCITRPVNGEADADSLTALLASLTEAKFIRSGRPPKLNVEVKGKVCMLLCVGLSRRQAATMLDIDQATISHAAQSDPDFGRALVRAEEFCQLRPHLAIAAAGLRDWRAAAWFLTHQQKSPRRTTSERSAELHQLNLQDSRQHSEQTELEDILREQRNAAKEQRDKAEKQRRMAEKQLQYEADNPQLFRRKKNKEKRATEETRMEHG